MVNINCNSDCIYQSDGKCTLAMINEKNECSYNTHADCIYYSSPRNRMFTNPFNMNM